ncbi:uncharacterized protein BDZ99DRAFT_473817 [Mytilinidion resinicola]|uniref:DUF7624 domain-containing protein n=1 Tax=Mytilinidion resinicola TaxID=574789 RepID=A0A6A6YX50_9PEZI|nr:uncharacterized protein BDZ99DRAFT_473817 [Mytilinidion resinicola]KAF2813099.1 hypothetical protein BDZ99DRAFT_473817 [Mytilinidion resinicola]
MATATQLMPSPTQGLKSAFSPYTDSPSSPAPFPHSVYSNRSSGTTSDHLHPPPSPYPAHVDPSPVDSNGTVSTEIEDESQENPPSEDEMSDIRSPDMDDLTSPSSQGSLGKLAKLETMIPTRARSNSDEAPQSVIHAPTDFKTFQPRKSVAISQTLSQTPPPALSNNTSDKSDNTVVTGSPVTPESHKHPDEKQRQSAVSMMSPIDTSIISPPGSFDRATPRAQTRQEVEDEWRRSRSRASSNLADILESEDFGTQTQDDNTSVVSMGTQTMGEALLDINEQEKEVASLKSALSECWTLCNTLARLSQNHRERMFQYSGGEGEAQEQAWRSCWRLCQKLYESRNEDHASQVKPTLELCREFCQALFEVRQRGDEASDSVLRVSFELNNHLYNTHDRQLPEAFRERTLMKQRTSLPEETDALLRACWSLAEMLFSIRQNTRDGKPADEEILGSAIQACWELCDLFREGWTQIRPERGTPRPSQYTFPASISQSSRSERSIGQSDRSSLDESYHSAVSMNPETPTTIFDDRDELSPTEEQNVPNILVLGPEAGATRTHNRWSSAASTLSGYSETSQRTSSTATAGREDPHLIRLKALIIKAAMNAGYARGQPLPNYVKSLPANAFGSTQWQTQLLDSYRKCVLTDPALRNAHAVPPKRLSAGEVARAVQWMRKNEQFAWMRDLFRFVFGFYPEVADARKNIVIST